MKTDRPILQDSHLPFSLIFAGLALVLVAFNPPSLPQNQDPLSIIIAIFGTVLFFTSLALNRKRWLIAPIIGIAVTFLSALYSTTTYSLIRCGTVQISQGFPYAWIRRLAFPPGTLCPLYLQPVGSSQPQFRFPPGTIIAYTGFITDVAFYTLLALAILELAAAARLFQSTSKQEPKSGKPILQP